MRGTVKTVSHYEREYEAQGHATTTLIPGSLTDYEVKSWKIEELLEMDTQELHESYEEVSGKQQTGPWTDKDKPALRLLILVTEAAAVGQPVQPTEEPAHAEEAATLTPTIMMVSHSSRVSTPSSNVTKYGPLSQQHQTCLRSQLKEYLYD